MDYVKSWQIANAIFHRHGGNVDLGRGIGCTVIGRVHETEAEAQRRRWNQNSHINRLKKKLAEHKDTVNDYLNAEYFNHDGAYADPADLVTYQNVETAILTKYLLLDERRYYDEPITKKTLEFIALNKTLDKKAFGKKVSRARRSKGLSQKDLADLVGINNGYLSNIEGGRKVNITPSEFKAICDYFNWDVEDI